VKNSKRYYSVSRSVKINGAAKRPAVCYELTADVAAAVDKLVGLGQARIYDEEVRFVSGRALPVKRAPAPAPVAAPAPVVVPAPAPAAILAEPPSVPPDPVPEPTVEGVENVGIVSDAPVEAESGESGLVEREESADSGEGSETARKPRRTK
jgi:hypothetical protein